MGYLSVYGFGKDGSICCEKQVKNSFLSVMSVWLEMEKRHLPPYEKMVTRCCDYFTAPNPCQEIWDLVDDESIPMDERICLCTTFDNVLVKRESFHRVAQAFRAFGGSTNLPQIADVLDEYEKNPGIIAVGFSISVITGWDGRGPENEDGDCDGYNCLTQTEHFWLSDKLSI